MVYCAETIECSVVSGAISFKAEAYVSTDAKKLNPNRPYDEQKGRFRLFTELPVVPSATINEEWRVVDVDVPVEGRVICDAVRISLRNPVNVGLHELVNVSGPHARARSDLVRTVKGSKLEVRSDTAIRDERKLPVGSVLFALCDDAEDLVADKWQLQVDGKVFLLREVLERGRPDRPPLLLTEPTRRK